MTSHMRTPEPTMWVIPTPAGTRLVPPLPAQQGEQRGIGDPVVHRPVERRPAVQAVAEVERCAAVDGKLGDLPPAPRGGEVQGSDPVERWTSAAARLPW